jgi:hypothetical protein
MTEPHPWLEPLHRRVITLIVCLAWLVFELLQRETLWLVMATAASAYALWDFFSERALPNQINPRG